MDAGSLPFSLHVKSGEGVTGMGRGVVVEGGKAVPGLHISRSICVLLTRKAAHSSMIGWRLGGAVGRGVEGRGSAGLVV